MKNFRINDEVFHPTFGDGIIISIGDINLKLPIKVYFCDRQTFCYFTLKDEQFKCSLLHITLYKRRSKKMTETKNNMADMVNPNSIADDLIKKAEKEIYEESLRGAKKKLKSKLREQRAAKLVLSNINREIEEIKLEIKHDMG